jgi:hypothetical protein
MDHDETPINGSKGRRGLPAAAENAGLWLEERILWPTGDALKAARGLLGRCFESLAWTLRKGLLWPLQDRAGKLGTPGRAIAAVAAALVIAVGLAAVIGASSGGDSGEPASSQVAVATSEPPAPVTPKPSPKELEPTLEGAAPVFKPTKQEKSATDETTTSPAQTSTAGADPATATIGTRPGSATPSTAPPSSATSSSTAQSAIGVDGPPAGPEAIAVAKDFAGAFVLYETGGEESKVRKAFASTATSELAKSLLRRPPRLPANVKVPKAKVVNVVAGPSHGGVYTISVSLLRVGLTSELRLDMEKLKKEWRVTNVLG